MEIRKLQKKLLREELRRRRKNSRFHRLLVPGTLLALIVLFGVLIWYVSGLEERLEADFAGAEELLEQGDYDRAVAAFQDLHRSHPRFSKAREALFLSGEVLNLYQQKFPEAILAYLLVEKDYPGTETARKAQLQVAEVYKNRLRDYARAIVAYQKLLDSGAAGQDRIRYEVADAYFRLNDFAQALIEYETLLRNFPQSPLAPEVHYRMGITYSLEGDVKKAEGAFRRVIDGWPENPFAVEARFSLAGVLEEHDEMVAALEVLEKLQGIYPNAELLARRIDQVRERLGKKKKAI